MCIRDRNGVYGMLTIDTHTQRMDNGSEDMKSAGTRLTDEMDFQKSNVSLPMIFYYEVYLSK